MTEKNYPIPAKPVYDPNIRQLQNDDPGNAEAILNPLIQKLINNTHAAYTDLATKLPRIPLTEDEYIGSGTNPFKGVYAKEVYTDGLNMGTWRERYLKTVGFTANVQNAKVDVILPQFSETSSFWLEIEVTSLGHAAALGRLTKRFNISADNTTIYAQSSLYTNADSPISSWFAISDIVRRNADNRLYISIGRLTSAYGPSISINVRINGGAYFSIDEIDVGSVYTTDATVYPEPRTEYVKRGQYDGVRQTKIFTNLASLFQNDEKVGALKITIPIGTLSEFIDLTLKGSSFNPAVSFELSLSAYAAGQGWIAPNATLVSSVKLINRVRFIHDGTNLCILIGDLTTKWRGLICALTNAIMSARTIVSSDNWSIDIITSESGITNITETAVNWVVTDDGVWYDDMVYENGATGTLRYRKAGNIVFLEGSIVIPANPVTERSYARLPAGFRGSGNQRILALSTGKSAESQSLWIHSNGGILYSHPIIGSTIPTYANTLFINESFIAVA